MSQGPFPQIMDVPSPAPSAGEGWGGGEARKAPLLPLCSSKGNSKSTRAFGTSAPTPTLPRAAREGGGVFQRSTRVAPLRSGGLA